MNNGGRDKNWTYDLYDVNVAFYHWTTRPLKIINYFRPYFLIEFMDIIITEKKFCNMFKLLYFWFNFHRLNKFLSLLLFLDPFNTL